jgi:hypothetical protein
MRSDRIRKDAITGQVYAGVDHLDSSSLVSHLDSDRMNEDSHPIAVSPPVPIDTSTAVTPEDRASSRTAAGAPASPSVAWMTEKGTPEGNQ